MLLAALALTHLHPGSGRAPGVVDLPVQKDPLNYPIILASSAKGALKALCARKVCRESCLSNEGRIKCEKAPLCCCLFGSEPHEEESYTSVISILDFVPLAFPAPSARAGYVYVTTPLILRRVSHILQAVGLGSYADSLEKLAAEADTRAAVVGNRLGEDVDIAGMTFEKQRVDLSKLGNEVTDFLNAIQGLKGMSSTFTQRLIVVRDEEGASIVDKSLVRITRVRLRVDRKTVESGALWTEEYIPAGTVFVSGLTINYVLNKYCDKILGNNYLTNRNLTEKIREKLEELLGGKEFTFFVGGKESIGRGLIKVKVLQLR